MCIDTPRVIGEKGHLKIARDEIHQLLAGKFVACCHSSGLHFLLTRSVCNPLHGGLYILFERLTHFASCAVEQHTLVAIREAQMVAHLISRPSHDIAQGDDSALGWWQCFNRLTDTLACLAREQPLLGYALPTHWGRGPVSRPLRVI